MTLALKDQMSNEDSRYIKRYVFKIVKFNDRYVHRMS